MKLKSGKKVQIHSFKHDGSLHRVWISSFVIEDANPFLITGNQKTKVIESDGRSWYTKEPAIIYFFEKEWFNIIAMLKKDGIHYYCNISSPYVYDGEAIKYIDYDLDIKVYPNHKLYVLDQKEYDEHSKKMNYPEDIKNIIEHSMERLKKMINDKVEPFDRKSVLRQHEAFNKILSNYQEKTIINKHKKKRKK